MSDIPSEIITDILTRLPVKSLLRFRCVSKPWRSMIDNKDFIKLHLHHSEKTNSNRTLLVDSTRLFYFDFDSFKLLDIGTIQIEPGAVVASCNGLVLLFFKHDDVVLLWNPATRKSNKLPATLPHVIAHNLDYVEERYALGYDSQHDDYKVVRVLQGSIPGLVSSTKIYSLKSNSWKKVDDIPYMLPREKSWDAYLHDALHTVVKHSNGSQGIMAFDLVNEKHFEVPKPEFRGVKCDLASAEVMGGCLAIVVSVEEYNNDIWVMKEYGVKESWSKLLCFAQPMHYRYINLRPLGYSKSGDEVLLDYFGICLIWYPLNNTTATIIHVSGTTASFGVGPNDPPFTAVVCLGSLVSPYSPAEVETEKQNGGQGKKEKEIQKKRDDFLSVGFKLKL